MKSFFSLMLLALLLSSCSHQKTSSGVSISSASKGLLKGRLADFPVYLTDKIEKRSVLADKYSDDLFLVHTGHILKPNLSKADNEKKLQALVEMGYNLVNLTLEDFAVADLQGIDFEKFNLSFINSSVVDLNRDNLASAKNISPSLIHGELAFIGLSDDKIDKKLSIEKFIISDYVLSILKVKKDILKKETPESIKSFVIIHTLGGEMSDVMLRLPPSFVNSLAN